jgi:hypothetical protein
MTQAKFAEALGVNQAEIFKIEHRTEIRAIFPIVRWRISQFEELNSPVQVVWPRDYPSFLRDVCLYRQDSPLPIAVCALHIGRTTSGRVSMIAIAP